jgi:hypothetical protein
MHFDVCKTIWKYSCIFDSERHYNIRRVKACPDPGEKVLRLCY